jgi:hypothetical protein
VEEDSLCKLFNFVVNGKDNRLSGLAAELLLGLSDVGLDACKVVIAFVSARVESLCAFATERGGYTAAENGAVGLVISVLRKVRGGPKEAVVVLAESLFDRLFQLPANTVLHQDCLWLFAALPDKAEFVRRTKMIDRIPVAFTAYRQIPAVYWGHLHEMTRVVLESKIRVEETDAWKSYIAKQFHAMEKLLKSEYGGPSAARDNSDSSYEYDDDYEEDEYEYDDDGPGSGCT